MAYNWQAIQKHEIENAQEVSFEPLPDGEYKVMIVESEEKRNKSDNGDILKLKLQVIEGEHNGRFVFDQLNLTNPSPKAEEIGQRQLKWLLKCCNVFNPKGPFDLLNKVVIVEVGSEVYNDKPKNIVKNYSPVGYKSQTTQQPQIPTQTDQPTQAPVAPPTKPVTNGNGGAKPWRK